MFATLFKQKNTETQKQALDLYETALLNTRQTVFYETYGVPDTFDGRFDLLLLHIFIQLQRMMGAQAYTEISQALFDRTFQDMDQTLREMGIGDMGVPKHMKRMMNAFNGRMHSYQDALNDDTKMAEALSRNLYGTLEETQIDQNKVSNMINFVNRNIDKSINDNFENMVE